MHPGLCPIAQENAEASPMLCVEYGSNGWMDGEMEIPLALTKFLKSKIKFLLAKKNKLNLGIVRWQI